MAMRRFPWPLLGLGIVYLLVAIMQIGTPIGTAGKPLWSDVAAPPNLATTQELPLRYRLLSADTANLRGVLAQVPSEDSARAGLEMALPLPDGLFGRFRMEETAVMHPTLAAKFPELRTFRGIGIDDPSQSVRLTQTSQGFHALIFAPSGNILIEPLRDHSPLHMSYYERDQRSGEPLVLSNPIMAANLAADFTPAPNGRYGDDVRVFRLAVAATGEYTIAKGGFEQTQAAITTIVNNINGVYEKDLAVRFQLVANNDMLIFSDPDNDPYSNFNRGAMLDENQQQIDSTIGAENYDIGHVFSTAGGGVAGLYALCSAGEKAKGNSGAGQDGSDAAVFGIALHEIGHQFGSQHTFNSTIGGCSGNRSETSAYEPGSGSTIMSYAGLCENENITNNNDNYFHTYSLEVMRSYVDSLTCGNTVNTANTPPSAEAGANYTIPVNTPFELTGSASDDQNDPLTYGWEQFDLGTASPPLDDDGTRPIFRSFTPIDVPSRTFPQVSGIANNQATIGEVLPTTDRTMNFRFTVRDNNSEGGGFAFDTASVTVNVNAGPFRVTYPDTSESYDPGATLNIIWDVANTNQPPISCGNVDIAFSGDGGKRFDTMLVANTPNDGGETITLPSTGTAQGYIRVKCSNNIFLGVTPRFNLGDTVSKFDDTNDGSCDNDCSLREAIAQSNQSTGSSTIKLGPGTYNLNLVGDGPEGGDLDISQNLTIQGAGVNRTIIDANNLDRVIELANTYALTLTDLTIRNGSTSTSGGGIMTQYGYITLIRAAVVDSVAQNSANDNGGGGGIFIASGNLTIIDSTISGNRTENNAFGGGIMMYNFREGLGNLVIQNSTISGNQTGGEGGGGGIVFNPSVGTVAISNSTFSGNQARFGAAAAFFGNASITGSINFSTITANTAETNFNGGIVFGAGTFDVSNSIIAGNSGSQCSDNPGNGVNLNSQGFNLFGDESCNAINSDLINTDPLLAALANNGGPTLTHNLSATSPALNAADGNNCLANDQRGVARPVNNGCDIGAIEYTGNDPVTITPTSTPPTVTPTLPTVTPTTPTIEPTTPTISPTTPTATPVLDEKLFIPLATE